MTVPKDTTAGNILKRLSDLENYPDEILTPYEEFSVEETTYYFTGDGFLYRKETAGAEEEVGDLLCGYLTDEVWRYRTDERFRSALRPVMRLRRLLISESGLRRRSYLSLRPFARR